MRHYRVRHESDGSGDGAALAGCLVMVLGFAAYVRHCWWTLTMLMADAPLYGGKVVIAIGGILFPPFGVLHGVWLWFH